MADQITTSLAQAKVLVMKGQKGETGATPELSVGEVTTLSPGSNATATLSGTAENPVLNLGIPRGANGQNAVGFALLTLDENSRVDYNNAPITGAEIIALAAKKNAVFLWDEDNGRLYAFNGEQAGAAVFYYPMTNGNGCMLQILAANETETTDAWNPVLPPVTAADNGKVFKVIGGVWDVGTDETGGGSTITVDSALSSTSENPVQNKVINAALQSKGTYSKPSGGIPASDLASGVIPVVPQMATQTDMSDWTSGKTVDADTLKTLFTAAELVLNDIEADKADKSELLPLQTKAITDAGGFFTTDTVEGALQEIGAELAGVNTLIGSGVIA